MTAQPTPALRPGLRTLLIDGRSGSGKTELASALSAALGIDLVRLDDLYPGWDGLDAGSAAVPAILQGRPWRTWDWARGVPGEWRRADPALPIVVEGVGAISAASRALADAAIWMELDDVRRRERALSRDGESYAPHWDRWARQELAFIASQRPSALADLIVDGADAAAALAAAVRLVT